MKTLSCVLCLIFVAMPALGERGDFNDPADPFVAALGVAVGYTSGTGLAFRWPILPQTMAGLAGGLVGRKGELAWNTGFELHYVLRQAGAIRVHLGPAAAFYSDAEDDDVDFNASFGIGTEMLIGRRTALKADLVFTYLGDDGDVFPMPQVALLYYF